MDGFPFDDIHVTMASESALGVFVLKDPPFTIHKIVFGRFADVSRLMRPSHVVSKMRDDDRLNLSRDLAAR